MEEWCGGLEVEFSPHFHEAVSSILGRGRFFSLGTLRIYLLHHPHGPREASPPTHSLPRKICLLSCYFSFFFLPTISCSAVMPSQSHDNQATPTN
uniref:Uncharacterized protein n=1 Tax=Pseudonaja textilis TaxID=8673 RepID=A0A670YWY9_PSETE